MSGTKRDRFPRFSYFSDDPENDMIAKPATHTGGEVIDVDMTVLPRDEDLLERLCRDPGSLWATELESLIPTHLYNMLRRCRELFRHGGLFFQIDVSPRDGACQLILTTRCRLYERLAENFWLPDIYVARAVAECLDRWTTGRCATKKRAGKRRHCPSGR